ncbi:MAG: patatin-like phospholipase family protein [Polyangiales bacterium]
MTDPTPPPRDALATLTRQMADATTYDEWLALARDHDALSGAADWRAREGSSLYDYRAIQSRLARLRAVLDEEHCHELLYTLNEGVHGNMGGMGRPVLYGRARSGTKHLIDDYVAAIAEGLESIARAPDAQVSHADKLDFFRRASHCYGRSALLLSGGAGLIYFHHGVVQELLEHGLLPNVISGSSAGSAVAAQLGIYSDEELAHGHFREKRYVAVQEVRIADVLRDGLSASFVKQARERALDEIIPRDITFGEAYEKTGRYINISISPAEKHQSSRLMNAITSPNVYIRSAAAASSSIPGVAPPVRLYAKGFDGKPRPYLRNRRWVDGSFSHDLPVQRLTRLYGVNHFIVSLINPAVIPFIEDVTTQKSAGLKAATATGAIRVTNELLSATERLLSRAGGLRGRVAVPLALLVALLDQSYLGDINVLMQKSDFRWRQIFFEFEPGEIDEMVRAGQRRTWPKIAQVRNAALISRTLDRILEELSQDGLTRAQRTKHHQYV